MFNISTVVMNFITDSNVDVSFMKSKYNLRGEAFEKKSEFTKNFNFIRYWNKQNQGV